MKQYQQIERDFWLEARSPLLGRNAPALTSEAFEPLNSMVRSSSLIKMVNLQIRPCLNSCKDQALIEILTQGETSEKPA